MIKLQNIDKIKLAEIGRLIGESFMAEPGVLAEVFDYKNGVEYFTILTKICYESGCLYATSDLHEGFVAYWMKNNKPALRHQFSMLTKLLTRVKFRSLMGLIQVLKEWKGYEETYKNEKNYVAIFMLVVTKKYQGKGYMKTLLSEPFALADEKNIPCLLDTDSYVKSKKYEKCGMKTIKQMGDDDVTMYLMRYN